MTLFPELSQDLNGNSQAAATRQKMAQLEQMLSALDQLRRVSVTYIYLYSFTGLSQKYMKMVAVGKTKNKIIDTYKVKKQGKNGIENGLYSFMIEHVYE